MQQGSVYFMVLLFDAIEDDDVHNHVPEVLKKLEDSETNKTKRRVFHLHGAAIQINVKRSSKPSFKKKSSK